MTGITIESGPLGEKVIRCAWLVNPGDAPRQNVRVTIVDGRVAEICDVPGDELSQVADVAMMPAFVNGHTHLEFSQLASPLLPSAPFPDWIRSVVRYRSANSDREQFATDCIRAGLHESHAAGVRLIGEISTTQGSVTALQQALEEAGNAGVSFRELIGFSADQVSTQLQVAERHVATTPTSGRKSGEQKFVRGLSPHAPYSVHPELFEGIVDIARQTAAPVAIHLAETVDEVELLQNQTGRFVDFLQSLNLWEPQTLPRGTTPLRYLEKLAQAERALAVHGNYFGPAEISFLARNPHVAVVYCPRTHAYFGHTPHPWQQLQDAGAVVLLGTDSRASNPDLSVWKELQFVANQKKAAPIWELLPMITTSAAVALGFNGEDFKVNVGNRFQSVSVPCECDSESRLNAVLLRSAEATEVSP
ncbi:MAG: amidohydrolase family protein [Fuerstiella sp.]|nr:amidohydrolase family protein [Fuerstiella sp.]MCP4788503.1 amidohydrolase family protein [Fuerstiella sp.]MCP4859050.1 amidohydrolase family protein [Fuerstiella sp.]